MHEHLMRSLVDQHRRELMDAAREERRLRSARRGGDDGFAEPGLILADPALLKIRPIARSDADRITRLFGRLSPRSVHFRFFAPIRELSQEHLEHLVDVDHERRDALVALSNDEIIAVARYAGCGASSEAELAVTVEDTWQRRGIGTRLAQRLVGVAVARGYEMFVASILPENRAALRFVRTLSDQVSVRWNGGEYEASIPLRPA